MPIFLPSYHSGRNHGCTSSHRDSCIYFEFIGTVECVIDALSEVCEAKNFKMLKGPKHDIPLRLQEEVIKMADLTAQQTCMLEEIASLVRDVDELMAQMEALKECYSKVMNRLESHKRFVGHMSYSICRTIYVVDRCRGELMSRASDWLSGVST